MPRQQTAHPPASSPQQPQGHADVPHGLRDLLGARVERDVYLSTEQAAQYTGRPTREAFIRWARRHGIALRKPGSHARTLVVRKGDLDWALRSR